MKALSNGIDVKSAERQADADFTAGDWLPVQYLDSTLPASMITRYYRPERHFEHSLIRSKRIVITN